jgi:hypothetical protein
VKPQLKIQVELTYRLVGPISLLKCGNKWVLSIDGMIVGRRERRTRRESCPSSTLFTTNPTWVSELSSGSQTPHLYHGLFMYNLYICVQNLTTAWIVFVSQIVWTSRPDRFWGPPSLLSNGYQGLFPWEQSGRGVKLTTHLHLVLGDTPALPQYAFMAWCSVKESIETTLPLPVL